MLRLLTRWIAPLPTLLLLISAPNAGIDAIASPTPAPHLQKVCDIFGRCQFIPSSSVQDPGKTGTPGDDGQGGKQVKRICEFNGAAQACTSKLGNWSNGQQCYMRREEPPPPFTDARWQGHTDGSIWACVRQQGYADGEHLVTKWVWLPGEPDTVVIDPVTLAYRAVAEMQLAPPIIRTAPGAGQIGLVNMPVWLWVTKTENTWGPIERSASVPGLSVTAKAQVTAIDWTLGDGTMIRCEGPGTPYTNAMGVKDSPDCGHRYKMTSRQLPNCKYPVAATAQWKITWESTGGDNGEIDLTQRAATQLRIGEAVPVLVDPDGGDAVAPTKDGC
ncbi:hypothetical protein ACQPYH_13970 [Kribbella sp. CA-245084]|uniref:hypothetical protein n=1 Tax=Kribbella sp. CA-245084 TaxID=3239940 RepID=UPI003D8BEE6F